MTDTLPSDGLPKRPLDKRTALAVLDVAVVLLRAEAFRQNLLGKEVYGDGFDDAAHLLAELRQQVAHGTVSPDYVPASLFAPSTPVRCGTLVGRRACQLDLDHDGDCEP